MKTVYSEQYYKKDVVRENIIRRKGVFHLEEDLKHEMSIFENTGIDNDATQKLAKFFALRVYNKARNELIEGKQLYLKVRHNSSCLGYVNKAQETKRASEIVETFEYNCLLLKEFREKHCI